MKYLLYGILLAVAGCTPLTAAGERVRVVESPQAVGGCEYLGPIEGSGRNNAPGEKVGGNAMIAEASAENDARNQAGRRGADTLLELDTDQGHFSASVQAGAYRCGHSDAVADSDL
jgi:hypothetical protein